MDRYLPHWRTATWAVLIATAWMVITWATTGSIVPMVLWLIGVSIVLLLWVLKRPKQNVRIYGPSGQEWLVKAATARRRVRSGWSYEPQATRP